MYNFSGNPTKEQLALINKYRPANSPEYSAEELYVFTAVASNNLLHKNKGQWSTEVLEQMANSFVGKDVMVDHEWEESEGIKGMIFDTLLVEYPTPMNPSIANYVLKDSWFKELDQQILSTEGYKTLLFFIAMESSSEFASDLRYGRAKDTSVGLSVLADYKCPMCKTSFRDKKCTHYMPIAFSGDEGDDEVAPYYIRDGLVLEGIELSFVYSGNCPQSRLLTQIDLEQMNLLQKI